MQLGRGFIHAIAKSASAHREEELSVTELIPHLSIDRK